MEHTATYSPEDNKLRLYPACRLSAEEFAQVKAAGFKWAPKQELFVAPKWTPQREDLLLEMCGEIGDEDYSPEERAADRAERFSGYRDKRRAEAGGLADRFDAGPSAFGHQNRARAERQAARHDRLRTGAVSQWSKAEYWQMRTEGVIRNALYKSSAKVRRSRIVGLESELRGIIASYTPADNPPHYIMQTAWDETEPTQHVWVGPKGRGGRWVKVSSLEAIERGARRWVAHLELRLSYEKAMLGEEGGMVGDVDMVPGGWIRASAAGRFYRLVQVNDWAQIIKVNKSPATKRVTSVVVRGTDPYGYCDADKQNKIRDLVVKVERLPEDAYRAPTAEELEAFNKQEAAAKKERKATTPKAPSLINPTDADAERLQAIWNTQNRREPGEVLRITQAQYAANSKGAYARCNTVEVSEQLKVRRSAAMGHELNGRVTIFKVRQAGGRVIILTDKPQKPLPFEQAADVLDTMPSVETMLERMEDLKRVCGLSWLPDGEDRQLLEDAAYVGWAYVSSMSQFGWTPAGYDALRKYESQLVAN